RAFIWNNGTFSALGVTGTLGGNESMAFDINNAGTVVGASNPTGSTSIFKPFSFSGSIMTDLGALPGGSYGEAWSINNNGVIVGRSTTNNNNRAFYKTPGNAMTEIPGNLGGKDSYAYGLNNTNNVTGYASINNFGDLFTGFRWAGPGDTTIHNLGNFG